MTRPAVGAPGPGYDTDAPGDIDGPYAWGRLAMCLLISMIGGAGLWSVVVVLPAVEADFGVSRADASLPYTFTLIGVAIGTVLMGKLADRVGIVPALCLGGVALGAGYGVTSIAPTIWMFSAGHALLIGMLGGAVTFGPLLADISHWFVRRRGIAVAIAASGNYLAGTVWPPIIDYLIQDVGWRETHQIIGIFCVVTVVPMAMTLRRRSPIGHAPAPAAARGRNGRAPLPGPVLQALLIVAGLACCIAMAMPQVHIVAYCLELGYDSQRGAEMLSLMLATGIVSRLVCGALADRIGALPTLLLSSTLQMLALLLFLPFDGLVPLYVVSALFGLSQGGIVPTYALIVRQFFPASQAGVRVGMVLSATLIGMGVGGWMSGAIFDLTLSYTAAFLNGVAWNVLHIAIAGFLLFMLGRQGGDSAPQATDHDGSGMRLRPA
ncbi:MAG: MFS transporter [Alphaproteobacteria bacterium]|nr:MFS transporter [Alphaproteobacteria bacterium]